MIHPRHFLLIASFALAVDAHASPPLVVTSEQYVQVITQDGIQEHVGETVIPLVPGLACYGWRVQLREKSGVIQFTEVFSLPAEPEYWAGENDVYGTNRIDPTRTTSTSQKFASLRDGWFENAWCVAAGDPAGTYSFEVFVDDHRLAEFQFLAQNPADLNNTSKR